jgi:hypothetical protein
MAAIGICYTLLAVLELWRSRGDGAWRWPIMLLLLGHAASIPIHIPVAGAWKHPDPADVDLLTFMIFEAAFVSICAAYLLPQAPSRKPFIFLAALREGYLIQIWRGEKSARLGLRFV